MTLSSAEAPLCHRKPGKREKWKIAGNDGKGREQETPEAPTFSLFPSFTARLLFLNQCSAIYPAVASTEERVIYEAGGNNFRLRQIVLLIESDKNTNVIVLIIETANLVLDGRLPGDPRHFVLCQCHVMWISLTLRSTNNENNNKQTEKGIHMRSTKANTVFVVELSFKVEIGIKRQEVKLVFKSKSPRHMWPQNKNNGWSFFFFVHRSCNRNKFIPLL